MPDDGRMSSLPVQLRPYRPTDLLALYDVCLRTGDSGVDASTLYRDPLLLGHVYAAPYATFHPELSFVLDDGQRAVGYVLGVPDSRAYAARCEDEWSPLLRGLYPRPDESDSSRDGRLLRLVHRGYRAPESGWLEAYPAHLHIDLLPEAQGNGNGRRLIGALLEALRAQGVPGVHLGVGTRNVRAQGFYQRLGFRLLESGEGALIYGMLVD